MTNAQALELLAQGLEQHPCHIQPEQVRGGSWGRHGSAKAVLWAIRKAFELGKQT